MVRDLTGACGLRAGSSVLDYGSATSPYRPLLPADIEFLGADLPGNEQAQVTLNPDGTVPMPDGSFDLVLSTQVLEHVEDPDLYLRECRRLMRPGGSLVLSTHGIMYYHRDPEDYWRWTMVGLCQLLSRHGLVVREKRGVLGLAAVGLQHFQDGVYWYVPKLLRPVFTLIMQFFIKRVDRRYSAQAREDNGMVIAVRAQAVPPP